jgi:hypothetical protein
MKNKFKWTVEIEVDEVWVKDGFDLTGEMVQQALLEYALGYAYDHEVKAQVLSSPTKARILRTQGFKK